METTNTFKVDIFSQLASIAQAFSAPKRLELLDVLSQGERDVDSLSLATGMKVTNTSRHLQILRQSRLVENRREGVRKLYRIADEQVLRCFHALRDLGESRNAEIRDLMRSFHEERGALEAVGKEELFEKMASNDVVVLDVRPHEEFVQGHIAGALSIPHTELSEHLSEIPKDVEVIAYCRGPYCVWSVEVMEALREKGFRVSRLKDGFPSWKLAGLPVQR